MKAFLFDGKMDTISNKLTLCFKDNCISPFDQEFYKIGEIFIYMVNSLEFASYNSVFESSCYDSVTEKPTTQIASSFYESVSSQKIIIAIPLATQTQKIVITTQISTESKSKEKLLKKLYTLLIAMLISQVGMILLIVVLFMLIAKYRNRFYTLEQHEFDFNKTL